MNLRDPYIDNTSFYVNIYPEICCDECGNVIHNHFDCPICHNTYAGTDCYSDMENNEEFNCESCHSEFQLDGSIYDRKIKLIKNNYK